MSHMTDYPILSLIRMRVMAGGHNSDTVPMTATSAASASEIAQLVEEAERHIDAATRAYGRAIDLQRQQPCRN